MPSQLYLNTFASRAWRYLNDEFSSLPWFCVGDYNQAPGSEPTADSVLSVRNWSFLPPSQKRKFDNGQVPPEIWLQSNFPSTGHFKFKVVQRIREDVQPGTPPPRTYLYINMTPGSECFSDKKIIRLFPQVLAFNVSHEWSDIALDGNPVISFSLAATTGDYICSWSQLCSVSLKEWYVKLRKALLHVPWCICLRIVEAEEHSTLWNEHSELPLYMFFPKKRESEERPVSRPQVQSHSARLGSQSRSPRRDRIESPTTVATVFPRLRRLGNLIDLD